MISLQYLWNKFLRIVRGSALRDCQIHPSSRIESGTSAVSTKMDRHSYCGYDCVLLHCDIGPFCSIANRVSIGGASHPVHFVSTSPVFLSHKDSVKTKFARHNYLPVVRTKIGADVWIGEGAFIKAGIQVGPGAIIGMGAVVTRDVPPYAIVAGNPARLIRYRFEESLVERLLDSKWWDFSDEILYNIGPFVDDLEKFLNHIEAM